MEIIYRYETDFGRNNGPYNSYNDFLKHRQERITNKYYYFKSELSRNHTYSTHPNIVDDTYSKYKITKYRSGCTDIKSLKKWFWGFNTEIRRFGFKLVEIKVKKFYRTKSKRQVAFNIEDVISKRVIG